MELLKCDYCPLIKKFIPPKIVTSIDTTTLDHTATKSSDKVSEDVEYDYIPSVKHITLLVELTDANNLLVGNKTIFKRQKAEK